jgi:hypothetical protein
MKLMGQNKVEENVVKRVPYVDYTSTWHPLHHAVIVRAMETAIKWVGLDIISREYSLSKDGADMFGVWTIQGTNSARQWAVGFRNSMKKSFAFGGCAGNKVIVCDNMCFSGDMTLHRRHTSGMNRDQMIALTKELITRILKQCRIFEAWFDTLSGVVLDSNTDTVILNAIRRGIIAPNELGNFESAFEEELSVNNSLGTMADFHGGVTRLLRTSSLFNIQDRSTRLNTYCDDMIDMIADGDRYTADFLINRG